MGFLTNDRNQLKLNSYCISDFVDTNSKAFFIVKIVEQLDKTSLYNRYSSQGADAFEPSILLSTWFLAYSEGITSSRKLEELCKKHMDYIYISANLRPDHCSLSRFRKQHADLMNTYFIEIVKFAHSKGFGKLKDIAIDGSKIRAVASKKQCRRGYEIDSYIKALQEDITAYWKAADAEDDQCSKGRIQKAPKVIKKKIKELEYLREIRDKLTERQKGIKLERRKREHQITLSETEALLMDLGYGRGFRPSYNVQLGVDADSQLIVVQDTVQDRNDEKQFSRQVTALEKALGKDPERRYVADSGYHSFDQVCNIVDNNINGYISRPTQKQKTNRTKPSPSRSFSKGKFRYDKKTDTYICPNNNLLHRSGTGRKTITYKADDCSKCPLKKECTGKNKEQWSLQQKSIYRDKREDKVDIMSTRIESQIGRELMIKREQSVEPVIGNIKSNLRFDRFHLRGLRGAKGEFSMICIGHNLNKLYAMIFKDGLFENIFLFFYNLFLPVLHFRKI